MAIPIGAQPVALPPRGRRKSATKRQTDYGLDRDTESQLWVLASIHQFRDDNGNYPGFKLDIDQAKHIFNYPEDKEVNDTTFLTNANTSLKRRGPHWLKLGRRAQDVEEGEEPTGAIDIVFKHNDQAVPTLPTIRGFCNSVKLDFDHACAVLEDNELGEILANDEAMGEEGDTYEPPVVEDEEPSQTLQESAQEIQEEVNAEPGPDPESESPAAPKKKRKRKGKGKKS